VISNYGELTNGNSYIFQILDIENLQTGNLINLGVNISMSVIYYIQGQQQPTFMQGTYSYPTNQEWYDDNTTTLPIYNGRSPSLIYGGDDSNVLQLSD